VAGGIALGALSQETSRRFGRSGDSSGSSSDASSGAVTSASSPVKAVLPRKSKPTTDLRLGPMLAPGEAGT
jgi:hypothetical protein